MSMVLPVGRMQSPRLRAIVTGTASRCTIGPRQQPEAADIYHYFNAL
jgi:hypothetical protein